MLSPQLSSARSCRGRVKNSTVAFLERKHCEEMKLKTEALQLEKKKFDLERKERETRFELEIEERRNNLTTARQQRDLMEILLHLINKKE